MKKSILISLVILLLSWITVTQLSVRKAVLTACGHEDHPAIINMDFFDPGTPARFIGSDDVHRKNYQLTIINRIVPAAR